MGYWLQAVSDIKKWWRERAPVQRVGTQNKESARMPHYNVELIAIEVTAPFPSGDEENNITDRNGIHYQVAENLAIKKNASSLVEALFTSSFFCFGFLRDLHNN
jgi:hypothetical protein